MGCCESLSKIILIILNIVFFILGAAILGAGIWLKVDKSNLFEILRQIKLDDTASSFESSNSSALNILAILLIVVGTFTFVTGFCGCCGAINESTCLLYTYAFLVAVVVIVEISIAVYATVEKNKFQSKITVGLTNVLKNNFNGLTNSTPSVFTIVYSALMIEEKCCGVYNSTDFDQFNTWRHNNPKTNKPQYNPVACCPFKSDFTFKQNNVNLDNLLEQMVDSNCPYKKDAVTYKEGCIDKIVTDIGKNMFIVIGICVAIGLFEILCIVFACCLARKD